MEIGCTGSCSRASSIASRCSSRRSSTSSQHSESGRPRSALNSAYGALRRLVSRRGSDKSRTDTSCQSAGNGGLDKDAPLLESESCLPGEKLKRQEHARVDSTSSHSRRSSQSPAYEQKGKGAKEKTVKTMNQTKQNKEQKKKPANREPNGSLTSSDSSMSSVDASQSLSDADILAARGIILKRKLGEGTYAKVRSAYHTRISRPGYVAVKIISRQKTNQRYQRKFLPRELSVLRRIRHKNITRLLEHFEHANKVFMVMELANHGDLLEYVQRRRVLSDDRARYIFTQILDGVEYLHINGMFHRDLKCENILLNTGYKVKITDFGFAREWFDANNFCRTFCGSAAYASPEILQGIPYDPHVADIWSMGVILFIMITGTMPYDDSDVKKMLDTMTHNRLDFPRKRVVCFEVKTLLHSILFYFHRERATLYKIRHSPWMRGRCTMPDAETNGRAKTSSTMSAIANGATSATADGTASATMDAGVAKTLMAEADPTLLTQSNQIGLANAQENHRVHSLDRVDEKATLFP